MRASWTEYLFSVNTRTSPTMAVDSGEEFTVEVRGAFDDVEDIRAVPTPFTPACDGHPLAPIAGPIVVRGAKPGDVVAIDLSTSQRRLILASQPMVRRLSPGGRWTRTFGTAARKPAISETSRKRPRPPGPMWLTPPSPSRAGARPRRHLALPARQVCEAESTVGPTTAPSPSATIAVMSAIV